MSFTIRISGEGYKQFERAIRDLGEQKARKVYSMAINKTIAKVNTQVKRAVASQMGTTQANVVKHGGLRVAKASAGSLEASINTSGRYMPVKDFRPEQGAAGVTASPWADRELFDGTWINRGKLSRTRVGPAMRAVAGGHVFKNTGKFNSKSGRKNAIKALWGPSVPKEIVKDESAATFHRISDSEMPVEILRAVKVVTKGVVG